MPVAVFQPHVPQLVEAHQLAQLGDIMALAVNIHHLTPREGGHIQAHFQHSSQWDHALPTDAWDLTRCMVECRKQNLIASW